MKQKQWLNNAGQVAFTAPHSFTKRILPILEFLRRMHGDPESHMRVGNFSVVVYNGEVLAAETYTDGGAATRIQRDSKYWGVHVKDRTRQINQITANLKPTHPHAAEIAAACTAELAQF